MAALQSIRSRAGLLIAVLGLALLAFILGDFLSSGNALFAKIKDNAFSVNGEVVTTGEFARRIETQESFESIMSGRQGSFTETERAQIREMTYQQIVKEMILDKEAEKLGLSVTKEELNDMVHGINISPILYRVPFFANPQTGMFDRNAMMYILEAVKQETSSLPAEQAAEVNMLKQIWLTLENMMKYQRLEEKYSSLVAGSVLVNNVDKESYIAGAQKEVNIEYTQYPYASIADSTVSVNDAELQTLYDKRKKNFKLDSDLRQISYFIKDVIPSESDYKLVEDEMNDGAKRLATASNPALVVNDFPGNKYVDAFQSVKSLNTIMTDFVGSASNGDMYGPVREGEEYAMFKLIDRSVSPDSIHLQMIAFPAELDAQTTVFLADSLYNEVQTATKFEEQANIFMPGSNGGDLGMINEMALISDGIPTNVLEAKVGSVSKVTITGRPILIRIAGKSKPEARVKLASVLMPVITSDKTQNAADNELAQFVNNFGNIDAFGEAALNNGYSLVDEAIINKSDIGIGDVEGTRSIVQWAYTEKTGEVKKFDYSDKRIVAIITDKIESKYIPLKEVKEELESELIRDKKAEKLLTLVKSGEEVALTKMDEVKSVSFNTNQIMGLGYEPVINAFAKTANVEQLKYLKGIQGVYKLNASEINMLKDMDQTLLEQEISQGNVYQLARSASAVLEQKMEIIDNRYNFW